MGVIYKCTCKTTLKAYIGQTKHTARYRWNQHVWESRNLTASQCRKLNNAIRKYGPDDFIIKVLLMCDNADLNKWETYFIKEHGTFENGYNLTLGGDCIGTISDETRVKLSQALKGKPKNVKDNRKRSEDNWLPKYLKHYIDSNCEGYKVSDHPNLRGGSVTFASSNITMEEKFMLAMEVLDALNDNTYVLEKKQEPIGIQSIPNGYRVRVKGYSVKTFQKKTLSIETKLALANQYLDSINKDKAQRLYNHSVGTTNDSADDKI